MRLLAAAAAAAAAALLPAQLPDPATPDEQQGQQQGLELGLAAEAGEAEGEFIIGGVPYVLEMETAPGPEPGLAVAEPAAG